ncbi:MAG: hypothetical protein E6Z79_01120 [Haemophilus parainfluenzae]|nr:hypothetical protein [Haemophilus parainfluenzae]
MKKAVLLVVLFASAGASSAPYNLYVPSDANATYTVIDKGSKGELKTIITKREGKAGITYSQRAYDCEMRQVMYLGSGETIEQMRSSKADERLSPINEKSIAWYVGQEACQ